MKRTTIFVPEELERDLQLCARRAGKSAAAVVREALAAYVARKQPEAALPSFAGAFESGRTDTAERHEEILFARLSPHDGAPVPGHRTPAGRRGTARKRR